MAIRFEEDMRIFTLETASSCYQMQADEYGVLLHLYYGRPVKGTTEYLIRHEGVAFSGNPYELSDYRKYSLDVLPQEFSSCGVGDYREKSVELAYADGSFGLDLRYQGYEIRKGAYKIEGMPAAHDEEVKSETLIIHMKDTVKEVEVDLYYGVFPGQDVITRTAVLRNVGEEKVTLYKMMSANIDFQYGEKDIIYLPGKWGMERKVERTHVDHAAIHLDSRRGTSSHHMNPSIVLCDPLAGEDAGECYSFQLVYSGGFQISVQKDQRGTIRLCGGIQPDQFIWQLNTGESFTAPQAVLCYSSNGLGSLSRKLHRFVNRHICRGIYMKKKRPILINNWEATYFDFDLEKLTGIAASAAELGIEMMVLDDGWFGKRNNDMCGLGDWFVNEEKLGGSMGALAEKINQMGMKFGLWFEPEMISEDSDLYRAHPDWALTQPGRKPNLGRSQMVLDMGRQEVRDYLFEQISSILKSANISYVKWDMNRSISDAYSAALPTDRQGEVYHRFVLGTYDLMERITSAFPEIMIEGCSGGGGRYDLGIMYYSPQIWCSDNTDAINRTTIQYGSSLFYPISTVGSHVSVCPNHQTRRVVPFHTRAVVAMAGSFGYEMDLQKLSEEEKEQVKEQVRLYHKYYDLVHEGDYYRLTAPGKASFMAWEIVSEDKKEALVSIVITEIEGNRCPRWIQIKGLDPEMQYELEDGSVHYGSDLMYAGLQVAPALKEYEACQIYLKALN